WVVENISSTGGWKRFSGTYRMKENGWLCIGLRHYNATGQPAVKFRKIKLERGRKPTDWSPSPDDKVELAKLGTTIIEGGYIKTSLLNASEIRSQIVDANYIRTIELDAAKITTGTLSTSRLDL